MEKVIALSGLELVKAVWRTKISQIQLIDGVTVVKLSPQEARALIQSGKNYVGYGTSKRSIRELRFMPELSSTAPCQIRSLPSRPAKWVECWRTIEAAVLPPSIEWLHSRRSGVVELGV